MLYEAIVGCYLYWSLHTTTYVYVMKSILCLISLKYFIFLNPVFSTEKCFIITKIKVLVQVAFYETCILLLWALFDHNKTVM